MSDRVKSALPEFGQPPVSETVLGVDFPALDGWNITHYGLLHKHFAERYPSVQTKEPLPAPEENFEPRGAVKASWTFSFRVGLDARCWFIDQTDTQLLQVQADRFLRNWRKREGAGEYTRYKAIRKDFESDWERFLSFLRANELPTPEPRQCEITYINQLDPGLALHDVFSFWRAPRDDAFLPSPETASFNMSYRIPGKLARLHVALNPGVRIEDGREVQQLTITVRG